MEILQVPGEEWTRRICLKELMNQAKAKPVRIEERNIAVLTIEAWIRAKLNRKLGAV